MAANQELLQRLRKSFGKVRNVQEKKMFSGITFMVNDKMCVSVGPDRLMCRIDPARHDEMLQHDGVSTVIMKGRPYKGFVHVAEDVVQNDEALNYWVKESLAFNKKIK